MNIKIERIVMSGRGPKFLYKLVSEGKTLFTTPSGSHSAWTKKKDAQRIVDAINEKGMDYVSEKLGKA